MQGPLLQYFWACSETPPHGGVADTVVLKEEKTRRKEDARKKILQKSKDL